MQRRDFIKYSALTGTTAMFPELLSAKSTMEYVYDGAKAAFFASKLDPVRLISGLVFDHLAEVYVMPMAKQALHNFLDGKSIPKDSLSYYTNASPELKVKSEIYVEPYKASIVTYSRNERTEYRLNKQKEIQIELIKKFDKERFAQIHQYFKDNHIKIKQYGRETISTVGNDLAPSDLFDIDYIAYGKHSSEVHIGELLKETNNRVFRELVV